MYFDFSTRDQILNLEELPESEYVLILGCGVYNNTPSPLLKMRLDAGIEVVKSGKAKLIILSGYSDGKYYDEVSAMRNYLIENGIDEDILIEDKKGDNTYYSIVNIEKESKDKIIIITQKWHLKRALYISNSINIENSYGYEAQKLEDKATMVYMNFREVFARVKAVLDTHGIHLE